MTRADAVGLWVRCPESNRQEFVAGNLVIMLRCLEWTKPYTSNRREGQETGCFPPPRPGPGLLIPVQGEPDPGGMLLRSGRNVSKWRSSKDPGEFSPIGVQIVRFRVVRLSERDRGGSRPAARFGGPATHPNPC